MSNEFVDSNRTRTAKTYDVSVRDTGYRKICGNCGLRHDFDRSLVGKPRDLIWCTCPECVKTKAVARANWRMHKMGM